MKSELGHSLTEIYLRPPEGVPLKPGTIWLLKKALYGLKQAGLEWFETTSNRLDTHSPDMIPAFMSKMPTILSSYM